MSFFSEGQIFKAFALIKNLNFPLFITGLLEAFLVGYLRGIFTLTEYLGLLHTNQSRHVKKAVKGIFCSLI